GWETCPAAWGGGRRGQGRSGRSGTGRGAGGRGGRRGSASTAEAGGGRFTGRRRAAASAADSTRLGGIQSPEVLEHEPPLLGREPRQLFPPRIAQSRARARRPGLEHGGKVHAVTRRGAAGALPVLIGLAAR